MYIDASKYYTRSIIFNQLWTVRHFPDKIEKTEYFHLRSDFFVFVLIEKQY